MQDFECARQVYIYTITNKINNKLYVGSTITPRERFYEHRRASKQKKYQHFIIYKASNKYGWNNFEFTIIEECCPLIRNDRENYWIDFYQTLNREFGYNMRHAGNHEFSEETREKMRISQTGMKHTEERKAKTSARMIGNAYSLGIKPSSEIIEKRKETMRNKSEEERAKYSKKISDAHKGNKYSLGRKDTQETKEKKSKSVKAAFDKKRELGIPCVPSKYGEDNPFYGKKHTAETLEKISGKNNHRYGTHLTPQQKKERSEQLKLAWRRKKRKQYEEAKKKVKKLF